MHRHGAMFSVDLSALVWYLGQPSREGWGASNSVQRHPTLPEILRHSSVHVGVVGPLEQVVGQGRSGWLIFR